MALHRTCRYSNYRLAMTIFMFCSAGRVWYIGSATELTLFKCNACTLSHFFGVCSIAARITAMMFSVQSSGVIELLATLHKRKNNDLYTISKKVQRVDAFMKVGQIISVFNCHRLHLQGSSAWTAFEQLNCQCPINLMASCCNTAFAYNLVLYMLGQEACSSLCNRHGMSLSLLLTHAHLCATASSAKFQVLQQRSRCKLFMIRTHIRMHTKQCCCLKMASSGVACDDVYLMLKQLPPFLFKYVPLRAFCIWADQSLACRLTGMGTFFFLKNDLPKARHESRA